METAAVPGRDDERRAAEREQRLRERASRLRPETTSTVGADELSDALASLPYRQRAALVLRVYDDVAARIGARARRKDRPLAVLAVAMLLIGTLAGFAAGHATRGTTRSVTVAGAGDGPQPDLTSTTSAPGSVSIGVQSSWSRLFVRTTAEGVVIRAFRDSNASPAAAYVEVSSNDAVAATPVPEAPSTARPIIGAGEGMFGLQEGAPARWAIVQVGPDVARVRASFGNGSDEMEPVNGIAVLAHLGTGPVVVDALDAQGKTLATSTVANDACVGVCSPTPTTLPAGAQALPAPGPEQPTDPGGARDGVTQAVAAAFEGSQSDQAMAGAIEGGNTLTSVFDALRAGSFARQVTEAKTVVDGIVFRSASIAAVKFHSDLGADGTSGPYFADAAHTADGWQVTRASYCQIVTAAGAHCP
jgi:hypothetical protein